MNFSNNAVTLNVGNQFPLLSKDLCVLFDQFHMLRNELLLLLKHVVRLVLQFHNLVLLLLLISFALFPHPPLLAPVQGVLEVVPVLLRV